MGLESAADGVFLEMEFKEELAILKNVNAGGGPQKVLPMERKASEDDAKVALTQRGCYPNGA